MGNGSVKAFEHIRIFLLPALLFAASLRPGRDRADPSGTGAVP